MIYAFAGCRLDPERRELWRDGARLDVEPKVFEVLLHLLRHRERVVSKAELLEAVWPGVRVVESTLTRALSLARSAVGDRSGAHARVIRTLRGAGYRLVADVAEIEERSLDAADPFIGRESVLGALSQAWQRTREGAGGVALLAGEPGIGKTRAAEEFARRARAEGARVLAARAWETEAAPPYWMWVQLLRGFLRLEGAHALAAFDTAALASLVPELSGEGGAAPEPALAGEGARFRLYDALAHLLPATSRTAPVVVLLDDLHWADRSSLRALAIATPELGASHTLVVGTYRDEEVSDDHPLMELLDVAARLPGHHHLRLAGLSRSEAAVYVGLALGATSGGRLTRTLFDRSAGNPLFLRQLVQLVRERAELERRSPDQVDLAGPLPPGLRALILRRVERLSKVSRDLLACAAVVGNEFELSVLSDVAGLQATSAVAVLDEALTRGLVREVRAGRYRFAHELIREALALALPRARREALHRSAADALAGTGATSDDAAARLAHHHYEAARAGGDARAAAHWARRAGEIAARCLAHDDAAAHFARALEMLALERSGPDLEECDLCIAHAEALGRTGDVPGARRAVLRAAEVARALDRPLHFARAVLALGKSLPFEVGQDDSEQIALVEEALDRVGADAMSLRAELSARLSLLVYWTGDRRRCLALAEEALRCGAHSGEARPRALARVAHYTAAERPDRPDDPRPRSDELLASAERAGDAELLEFALTARILARFRAGDARGAERDLEAQRALGERTRHAMIMSHSATLRGMFALFRGRADEAEALAFEGLRLGERYDATNVRQAFGGLLLAVRLEQGRGAELEPALRGLLATWPEMGTWTVTLGWLLAATGSLEEAHALLRKAAADDFALVGDDHLWSVNVSTAALTCGAVGDAEIAATLYEKLRPLAGLVATGPLGPTGPFDWYLGCLARVLGRADPCATHLRAAIALADAMGSPLYAGRARCEYARALLDRGAPDAGAQAAELLAEVLGALAACDLPALRSETETLRARLRGAPEAPSAPGEDLGKT